MKITIPISPNDIWIDVGAYLGKATFEPACLYPQITVYAFEPHPHIFEELCERTRFLVNYMVVPAAISEQDGTAPFHLTEYSPASSLLPFNPEGLKQWQGSESLRERETIEVHTLRLDTFLNNSRIPKVAFLKIDAQGSDLAVVRSAGERLKDVERVLLEVQVTEPPLYEGAASQNEVLAFMEAAGFRVKDREMQSHGQEENLLFERAR